MRTSAHLDLITKLRDLGVKEYSSQDPDGHSFTVSFGGSPAPVKTEAKAESDSDPEDKLPPLPKNAAALALALGDR